MSSTINSRLDEFQDPEDAAPRPEGLDDRVRDLLPDAVVDELLAGARTEQEIAGQGGLLAQLTKRMLERAMEVELTDHLEYEAHAEPPGGRGNIRNGSTPKRLITESGEVPINTPRDRDGSFEPQIVRKRQRRFEGFDDKILALYARGMSTRDISAHLQEIYGVEVGRDLVSKVTDAVMDDARAWQTRPLEDIYPVAFLDAMVLKIRDNGSVQRKACYLAMGITLDGDRDVLGLWLQDTGQWATCGTAESGNVPAHPDLSRRTSRECSSHGERAVAPRVCSANRAGAELASEPADASAYLPPLIVPFVLAGTGMARVFAPAANAVLRSVRPVEAGQASGAANAIRELGGVSGLAVLASVFSADASYVSPARLHSRSHRCAAGRRGHSRWRRAGRAPGPRDPCRPDRGPESGRRG